MTDAIPVRRLAAALGLVALGVIGYLLALGRLSPVAAGQRAALTLASVVLVSRLAAWGFGLMLASLEPAGPDRRAGDPPVAEPGGLPGAGS